MNAPVQLAKGQNAPLAASSVVVTVQVGAPADLSALLVTSAGKFRSDDDFIFYNQPQGPGVRCVPPTGGQPWQVHIDLGQVPADIERVRLVTSLDEDGRTFGSLSGAPVAQVADQSGAPIATAELTGLSSESIVVACEVYRRNGAWKVRSVGQGYGGGLADLIRDHGGTVDDDGAGSPEPAPPAQAAPAAGGFGTPPTPQPQQGQQGGGFGQPPAQQQPQQGGFGAPPQGGGFGQPPAQQPQQHGGFGQPGPMGAAGAAAAGGQPGQEQGLTTGRTVNLSKGQRINLKKEDGSGLTYIRMGLGWDPLKRGGLFGRREAEIDLDASAILLAGADPVDMAFYNNLTTRDGSVQHRGDNRTGEGEGDDETIMVDLTRVPAHVTTILFVVSSYEGHTFQMVNNAFCRLVDEGGRGGEMARYQLSGGAPTTGMVMAKVYRDGSNWKMEAIGEPLQARVPQEILPHVARFVG